MLKAGFTKCPVCGNKADWENYSSSWGTEEEYITQNQAEQCFFTEQYSEPKYDCPECGSGHMRKNLMMVLASYPPKYQYECDTCGHVDYLDF